MKKLVAGLLLVCSPLCLVAADPVAGDSRERVLDLLGNPRGTMNIKGTEVLFFERGSVELAGGKVTEVKLVTDEQLSRQRVAAERKSKQDALARAELLKAGEEEKKKALADDALAKKSGAEQVAFWQNLAKAYPGVEVGPELQKAQEIVQQEERRKQEAAMAARKAQEEQPKLNSSKRRRYVRAGLLKEPEAPGAQAQ